MKIFNSTIFKSVIGQIFGMTISFIISIEYMTYEYYCKKPIDMCENKFYQIFSRNPKLINCLNRKTCHPLIRKYSNTPFIDYEFF